MITHLRRPYLVQVSEFLAPARRFPSRCRSHGEVARTERSFTLLFADLGVSQDVLACARHDLWRSGHRLCDRTWQRVQEYKCKTLRLRAASACVCPFEVCARTSVRNPEHLDRKEMYLGAKGRTFVHSLVALSPSMSQSIPQKVQVMCRRIGPA